MSQSAAVCTVKVNIRVIAATNRDLRKAVRQKKFREDLYYRLCVFPIEVPPLRQRKSDIGILAEFFVERFSRELGKHIRGFDDRSLDIMLRYEWPGNIRELKNVIERAVILASGPALELKSVLLGQSVAPGSGSLADYERDYILQVLKGTRGVVTGEAGAAKILGLRPKTLRDRMKKLGISVRFDLKSEG